MKSKTLGKGSSSAPQPTENRMDEDSWEKSADKFSHNWIAASLAQVLSWGLGGKSGLAQ